MDSPLPKLDQICELMQWSAIDRAVVLSPEFAGNLIDDGEYNNIQDGEMIEVIQFLICHFDFNVRIDNDILLVSSLEHNRTDVAIYLVDQGCDPNISILYHRHMVRIGCEFISYNFIDACISRNIKIDWLHQLSSDSNYSLYKCIRYTHFKKVQTKKILNYLMTQDYLPSTDIIEVLILVDYGNVIEEIIDTIDIFDTTELMFVALKSNSMKTIKMFSKRGVRIDTTKVIQELPVNESVKCMVDLLYDNNCEPVEIIEILKRLARLE